MTAELWALASAVGTTIALVVAGALAWPFRMAARVRELERRIGALEHHVAEVDAATRALARTMLSVQEDVAVTAGYVHEVLERRIALLEAGGPPHGIP